MNNFLFSPISLLLAKIQRMLLSMTGFGKSSGTFQGKKVSVEIRSLNSKSLDLNIRSAGNYKELEPSARTIIAELLERGKIDLNINLDSTGDTKNYAINKDLAAAYFKDLQQVYEVVGGQAPDYVALILRMPDIFNNEKEELNEDEKLWITNLIKDAAFKLTEFRRSEGEALEKEFEERIEEIRAALQQVPKYEQERVDVIRERMRKGLEDLKAPVDENRLEQELIFYIEKLDVSEEKLRLTNHLDYFLDTMKQAASGKKLGFIAQEIGREINTLGSKSNHAEMQKLVVGMKDSLEKIKEQVLNTL